MRRALPFLVLCLLAACGGGSSPHAVVAEGAEPIPTYTPTPPPASGVHFETPEAAMRYLAAAWNRHDTAALKHVTDPNARDALEAMRTEAIDLRLDHCTYTKARRDYECFFRHDYPAGYVHKNKVGSAEFTVGPADRPGWYMTYFIECG